MIHLWIGDRRGFVDFITNRKPINRANMRTVDIPELTTLRGEDIALLWQNSPDDAFSLPNAVIVAEGTIPDFLAWVSTYFRHIRPFTAHCRVLTPTLMQLLSTSNQMSSPSDLRSADIGMMLAEGIAYSVGRTELNRLSFTAFTRTFSFTYAQGVKRYAQMFFENPAIFEQIKTGWLSAREILNQSSLALSSSEISDVWAVVMSAASGTGQHQNVKADPLLVEALKGVRLNGRVPHETWMKLSDRFQKSESVIETMEGPREGRVKAVEMMIRKILQGTESNRRHGAFLAGYLASRVQPGSLDHFPLLFPAIAELRESFLWYGACSGLTPETSVDNYGNGIGWLIKRELGRRSHWLERPTCDIALAEMALLLKGRDGARPSIQTLISGVLKVEVFPMILTNIKSFDPGETNISDRDSTAIDQRTLFGEDVQKNNYVLELLQKIEENAMSLDAIRKSVEMAFGHKASKGRKRRT